VGFVEQWVETRRDLPGFFHHWAEPKALLKKVFCVFEALPLKIGNF
jgi:hypothetical protein